jgi:hypothetical protein
MMHGSLRRQGQLLSVEVMMDAREETILKRLQILERQNRRWRLCGLLAGAVTFGIIIVEYRGMQLAAAQQPVPRAGDEEDASALFEELHRLGHRAMSMLDRSTEIGAPVPDSPARVAIWSLRMLGTDLYRSSPKEGPRTPEPEIYLSSAKGPPNPERIRAFEEHLGRMQLWEKMFQKLADAGDVSRLDLMEFQSRRLVAQIWLIRERHKPGASGGLSSR